MVSKKEKKIREGWRLYVLFGVVRQWILSALRPTYNIAFISFTPILLIGVSVFSASAMDLGAYGETMSLQEPDLMQVIEKTLYGKHIQSTRAKQRAIEPGSLDIPHAEKHMVHTIDPSITLTQDYKDNKGRIFARRGQKINPLEKVSLRTPLLFIDCREQKHIEWAITQKGKKICTAGSPSRCMDKYKPSRFFFDYKGLLSKRLKITHVPSMVTQDEHLLSIHTVPLQKKGKLDECESCYPNRTPRRRSSVPQG